MTTVVLILSCIGYLLIVFPVPGSVYIASVIIGFSFGGTISTPKCHNFRAIWAKALCNLVQYEDCIGDKLWNFVQIQLCNVKKRM
ncbi:hypothetical protein LguiA_030339 [Lonicera macranthoides]